MRCNLRGDERAPRQWLGQHEDCRSRGALTGNGPRSANQYGEQHELVEILEELREGVERSRRGESNHHARLGGGHRAHERRREYCNNRTR